MKLKRIYDITHPTMHRQRQAETAPEATEDALLSALEGERDEETIVE